MKTATVTWIYYENFGTFLQAYALQKCITGLGYDNVIIDDSHFYKPGLLTRLRVKTINAIKGRSQKSHRAYRLFAKRHLNILPWNGKESTIANSYDAYICGSDQIWSPYLQFNPYYYLGFTEKKKIAYAPSTGTGCATEEYKNNVKPYIEEFSHVAVREEDGARMLSTFIDKDIKVVLDPTLLLTKEEWNIVECRIETSSPYILCYFLTPNKWYIDYVKEYARKHNKKVKVFNTDPLYKKIGFDVVDAGPGEFISYIKNAETVFTDSFHSSIFSILFHKRFVTFKRFEDGGKKDQNSRIANLFQKLGISQNFIGEDRLYEIETLGKPDFDKIEKVLNRLREESKEYLRNAIEN